MSGEELERDELDGAGEDNSKELTAADDGKADNNDGDEAPTPSKKAKVVMVEEELPSVEAKQEERDTLAEAMEEFLSRGGKVQEIESSIMAGPPKKPDSKYGSRPI